MYSLILERLEENNKLLKEILGILKEITSKEHIEKEDLKAFLLLIFLQILW